jgi:hypothetical protein
MLVEKIVVMSRTPSSEMRYVYSVPQSGEGEKEEGKSNGG